jgi:hypothetical protein
MILGMLGIADVSRPAGSGRGAEAIVKQVFGDREAHVKFSIIRVTPKHCRKKMLIKILLPCFEFIV